MKIRKSPPPREAGIQKRKSQSDAKSNERAKKAPYSREVEDYSDGSLNTPSSQRGDGRRRASSA